MVVVFSSKLFYSILTNKESQANDLIVCLSVCHSLDFHSLPLVSDWRWGF